MELTVEFTSPTTVRAGYACPCGCNPSVHYEQGTSLATDACCCGNDFAVGPHAATAQSPRSGYGAEARAFDAPWGERLEAAWLVGPSVHGPSAEHDSAHHEDHHLPVLERPVATDPVCGMAVDHESARAAGLHSAHEGLEYFFCGRGCKLEFDEDPHRYLDPAYVPTM